MAQGAIGLIEPTVSRGDEATDAAAKAGLAELLAFEQLSGWFLYALAET